MGARREPGRSKRVGRGHMVKIAIRGSLVDEEDLIEEQFGYRVPLVVRTRREIEDVVKNNPFLRSGNAPIRLRVAILAEEPGHGRIARLDPDRSHRAFSESPGARYSCNAPTVWPALSSPIPTSIRR